MDPKSKVAFFNRMIRGLGTVVVAQIGCGDRHSVALTKAGQLFAWGDNSFGQLGIGKAAGNQKAAIPKVDICS
jgi:alpha-tubulin suppressor-like RCC1 family protein